MAVILSKVRILRLDGTSLYINQGVATSIMQVKEHDLDFQIYVVDSKQKYHSKYLFEILNSLGYESAKDCYHLSYGMLYLPEWKMKSCQDRIIDIDELIDELKILVTGEIRRLDRQAASVSIST